MKMLTHPIEHLLCTLFGIVSPWFFPMLLAQNTDPGIPWNWSFFGDMAISSALGLIGGACALVPFPVPERDYRNAMVRVLIGAAVAGFGTGVFIQVALSNHVTNLAVRSCVSGLMGFFSYPLVIWLGKFKIKDLAAYFVKTKEGKK